MTINEREEKFENSMLEKVRKEIEKQLEESQGMKDRFLGQNIEMQRNVWEEVGAVLNLSEMDNVVSFMNYMHELKRLKTKHEMSRTKILKFEKMMSTPYFGRLDFIEDGEDYNEKIYIGMGALIDDNHDILVYDWRAPISSMYYDYEIGKAKYICPKCIVDGEIMLKRQYKIADGKIQYMFDSNLKIDDDILQEMLGKSADSKMKTIVTTIQKEQNKVIRNEDNKVLVVQGPAGSGKTSIALHRIAYLLYKHRDRITPDNILIFSPNDIFNDYISNVLPELGEENIYQTTYKDYMHKIIGGRLIKEDMSDMMEYILNRKRDGQFEKRMESIKFKSSAQFVTIVKNYLKYLDSKAPNFKDIIYNGQVIVDKKELNNLFYNDYRRFPLRRRLNKIRERIFFLIDPLEKARIKEISEELEDTGYYLDKAEIKQKSIEKVREENSGARQAIFQMTNFDLMQIYKNLFRGTHLIEKLSDNGEIPKNFKDIAYYTLNCIDAGFLNYEDQPALLLLKTALGDAEDTSAIKYIVIDEAQDYNPLQYEILRELFPRANITMLGDLSQSINSYMNVGNYDNVKKVFDGESISVINLTKSYRSTAEITAFSRAILGDQVAGEWVERSGEKPQVIKVEKEKLYDKVLYDVEMFKNQGYKSIGVISRNKEEAFRAYKHLSKFTDIKLVQKDDHEYSNGVVIIPSYLSKGLEFDVVIVLDAGGDNYVREDEKNLLYTVCTRALHKLNIYYSEENSVVDRWNGLSI